MWQLLKQNEQPEHNWIFYIIKKDFFSIPVSVRIISFSLFLFVLWRWLWADTFFSIYIKTIVDNVFRVSVIGALLALSKLFFTLPIGTVDDHSDMKSIIVLSKVFYVFAWFLYFAAWMFMSVHLLLIAVILNGFASATLMTTYQTFVREHSRKSNRSTVFWLYFSSLNLAYLIGALISAVLIKYIHLPYVYLFIVLFALISLLTDRRFPSLSKKRFHELLWEETFLHNFFREVFSLKLIKDILMSMKWYSRKLFGALWFEFLFNFLNYVWFLFIPIVAIANNLTLSEIAILFGVMRLPYLVNFFTGEVADRYNKKTLLLIITIFLAFLFALLGFNENFGAIMTISFGIAVWLAMMRPIISGMISDYAHPKDGWTVTSAWEFTWRIGEICGALIFGILSAIVWLNSSFMIIGAIIFVISTYQLGRKFLRR